MDTSQRLHSNLKQHAFELFLQGKQSVEVAIELDMPADKVEELRVQYWGLSNLDNLEIMYYEVAWLDRLLFVPPDRINELITSNRSNVLKQILGS
jgi:hypothetical protein